MWHATNVVEKVTRSLIAAIIKRSWKERSGGDKPRDKKEDKTDAQDSQKGKEKANVASSVMIEDLSDVDDILTVTMSPLDAFVGNM